MQSPSPVLRSPEQPIAGTSETEPLCPVAEPALTRYAGRSMARQRFPCWSQNGCSDSSTFNVRIYPIPTSAFSIPPNVCVNDPLSISYTGSASATATYTWNFGSGSVLAGSGSGPYSVVWNTSGNPAVTLTVTENGCVSPVTTLNTFIAPLPVPHAGLDVGDCSGTSVNIGALRSPEKPIPGPRHWVWPIPPRAPPPFL